MTQGLVYHFKELKMYSRAMRATDGFVKGLKYHVFIDSTIFSAGLYVASISGAAN